MSKVFTVLGGLINHKRVSNQNQLSHHPWSSVVSWEVVSFQGRAWTFQRMILHGEARAGMHSHLREAGFTQLWWIQGAISATLTVVGVDKIIKVYKPVSIYFDVCATIAENTTIWDHCGSLTWERASMLNDMYICISSVISSLMKDSTDLIWAVKYE
jgi:hypothetical protein